MSRGAYSLASASLGGLLVGATVPGLDVMGSLALPALFVQTTVTVGGLAESGAVVAARGWAWRMVLVHHLVTSVPLMLIGCAIGLHTWLGAGTFLLGAVPPAAALPSYAAALGGQVKPLVRFCLLGYAVGLVATPALAMGFLGTDGRAETLLRVLVVGLVLPWIVGAVSAPVLSKVPRGISMGAVSGSALVLMVGMGAHLRTGVEAGLETPVLLAAAAVVALGRCLGGGVLAWCCRPRGGLRLEAALAGGGKNAVLAAVLADQALGGRAALPALLGLVIDGLVLGILGAFAVRGARRATRPDMVRP
jgi:predicted Na+-dependent transporter